MRAIDVSIVTFSPDLAMLQRLLDSIAEAPALHHLCIEDNSADGGVAAGIAALPQLQPGGPFVDVNVGRSGTNVGFGRAHNANAARGTAPFVLVVNQDCVLEPGALAGMLEEAANAP